jgi:hypothetical protein
VKILYKNESFLLSEIMYNTCEQTYEYLLRKPKEIKLLK